jgi:hypothetical protein
MPFHIEVSSSRNHARSFNLTAEELRQTVLEPWVTNLPIVLGDRKWKPEESELTVIEGPELSNPEISFGQGWSNAERGGENVTAALVGEALQARRDLATGPAMIVIETDSPVQTVAGLVSGQQNRSVSIDEVREKIDSRDPEVAAVIVVLKKPA